MESPVAPIIALIQNSLIGFIGWLISWFVDVYKGKHVSFIKAVIKVACGWFCAEFFTPMIIYWRSLPYQFESFLSAVLWILWYKIIEFILSLEFFEIITTFMKEKGREIALIIFKPKPWKTETDNTSEKTL